MRKHNMQFFMDHREGTIVVNREIVLMTPMILESLSR